MHMSCWKEQTSYSRKQKEVEVIPDSFKKTCKRVSQKPLLPDIGLAKFNGEPMHVAQGLLTHQNSEIFEKLIKKAVIWMVNIFTVKPNCGSNILWTLWNWRNHQILRKPRKLIVPKRNHKRYVCIDRSRRKLE